MKAAEGTVQPKNHPGTRAREVRRAAGRVRTRESTTAPDDEVSRARVRPRHGEKRP